MTKLSELPTDTQRTLLAMIELDIKMHKELLEDAKNAQQKISDRIEFLEMVKSNQHSIENFVALLQRKHEVTICVIRRE